MAARSRPATAVAVTGLLLAFCAFCMAIFDRDENQSAWTVVIVSCIITSIAAAVVADGEWGPRAANGLV